MTTLILDVHPGERIVMSGPCTVEILHKSGQRARMRVTAPVDVRISREAPMTMVEVLPRDVPSMAT